MWKSCRGSTPWIGTTLGGWPSHYCCYPDSPDLARFSCCPCWFFLLFFTKFWLPGIVQLPSRSTWRLSTTPRTLMSSQKSSSTSVSFRTLVFCGGNWKKMGQALNCNNFFRKTKQGRWWGGLQGLDVHELHFQKVNPLSASQSSSSSLSKSTSNMVLLFLRGNFSLMVFSDLKAQVCEQRGRPSRTLK